MAGLLTMYLFGWREKRFAILFIVFLMVPLGACETEIHTTVDEPLEILFIGNSFTFFNNMPLIFADLAESGGHRVNVISVARGGFSLEQHSADLATLDMLENKHWDYVILQEKSGIPAMAEERDGNMYPLVRLFNEQIQFKGGEPILFMTWGNRDGLPRAGHHTYEAMQSEIAFAYSEIGDELDVRVAPVGIAWQQVLEQNPQFDLWGLDGIHPSLMGSFLAANVLYAAIFGESPLGLTFSNEDNVGKEARVFLQGIAADVVLGDPGLWNIP